MGLKKNIMTGRQLMTNLFNVDKKRCSHLSGLFNFIRLILKKKAPYWHQKYPNFLGNVYQLIVYTMEEKMWSMLVMAHKTAINGTINDINFIIHLRHLIPSKISTRLLLKMKRTVKIHRKIFGIEDLIDHVTSFLHKKDICHLAITSSSLSRLVSTCTWYPPEMMDLLRFTFHLHDILQQFLQCYTQCTSNDNVMLKALISSAPHLQRKIDDIPFCKITHKIKPVTLHDPCGGILKLETYILLSKRPIPVYHIPQRPRFSFQRAMHPNFDFLSLYPSIIPFSLIPSINDIDLSPLLIPSRMTHAEIHQNVTVRYSDNSSLLLTPLGVDGINISQNVNMLPLINTIENMERKVHNIYQFTYNNPQHTHIRHSKVKHCRSGRHSHSYQRVKNNIPHRYGLRR
jgi:hypothetical protein